MSKGVNKLTTEEGAYIAGLVDGEGSVLLTRKSRNCQRHVVVSVCNTEYNLLEKLIKAIGVGKITNKKAGKKNHAPSFNYSIANRQALDLLAQIYPHLASYKRERARLILDNYIRLTPRNGRYSQKSLEVRNQFVAEVLAIKPR